MRKVIHSIREICRAHGQQVERTFSNARRSKFLTIENEAILKEVTEYLASQGLSTNLCWTTGYGRSGWVTYLNWTRV